MPALVDTTIRLLAQEPLAGLMPTAELLRLAEILDKAGFAYLEVSGGGVFDTAVRRGVESPWERIRALNERTETPLAMALRGRFLVGSRPGRRRVRQPLRRLGGRERDRGLPPARPAERRREPSRGRRGDHRRGQGVRRRARLRLRLHERDRGAGRAGAQAARARRFARSAARPLELAPAAPGEGARRDAEGGERPAGRPLLPGRRRQRDGRGARGCARRGRPDRLRGLSGRAHRPPDLGRSAGDGARGPRARHRRRRAGSLARLGARGRAHRRRAGHPARAEDRRARRGAQGSARTRGLARRAPARARRGRPPRRGAGRAGEDPRGGRLRRRSPRRSARSSAPRRCCTCSRRAATRRSSTSCAR